MQLPRPDELTDEDHHRLYEHDRLEFHSPHPRSHVRLLYMARFQACVEALRRFAPAGTVADIGCAQGNLGLYLAEQGYRVVAMDLRPTFLAYLRKKWRQGSIWTVAGNACRLPLRGPFAAAILVEVVEHMAFPETALAEAASVLAPGGVLCLTTPNGERLHTGLPTFSAVSDRASLVDREFRPDADGHLFFFTRAELVGLVERLGLDVVHHEFCGSPWLSGRLLARYVTPCFPLALLRHFDRLTIRSDLLARKLAEGQLLVARRRFGET